MPKSYKSQLIALKEYLHSRNPDTRQQGFEILLQLAKDYSEDQDFRNEVSDIVLEKKNLRQELHKQLREFERWLPELARFLKSEFEKKPEDLRTVNKSPLPGITLLKVLKGHDDIIGQIDWSPDGRFLASPSFDETIRIWDVERGKTVVTLYEHRAAIWSVAWSPDGEKLASCSDDNKLFLWNIRNWKVDCEISCEGPRTIMWSPDGNKLALGHKDGLSIINAENQKIETNFNDFHSQVTCIAWFPNGNKLASFSDDKVFRIWNLKTGKEDSKSRFQKDEFYNLIWGTKNNLLVSGGEDNTIKFWDDQSNIPVRVLEAHNQAVTSLAFSADGAILASKSLDNTIRLWRSDDWSQIGTLNESNRPNISPKIAFHPLLPILATFSEKDVEIRVWELDADMLFGTKNTIESIKYTTAKIVLVGDSGVGKTGLGWRLAHGIFKEHASTHGQQFWVIDNLSMTREDGTQCEAVLWDLAGQQHYRLVHSIFLDEIDLALLLFDPTNREDPFKGVNYWIEQLKAGTNNMPPAILVGARQDIGMPVVSKQLIDEFCQNYGISGGYVGTSAKTGTGLDQLINTIKTEIPWRQKTTTVTTIDFKQIKEYLLSLKEKLFWKDMLIQEDQLLEQLKMTYPGWNITKTEMMTAVKHLENHGYVNILQDSSGRNFMLLMPEILTKLASSIVMQALNHPRDLGSLNERELFLGSAFFDELGLSELPYEEQHILLDAVMIRLLRHNVCFRDMTFERNNAILIFPSLIKQEPPSSKIVEYEDGASYLVHGQVENTYAALVVLLGYTQAFTRVDQWHNHVRYRYGTELQVCGFRLLSEHEGEIEIILYFGKAMPLSGRKEFQDLFETFLVSRGVKVTRYANISCAKGHIQERAVVIKHTNEKNKVLYCDECGGRISLADAVTHLSPLRLDSQWIRREVALALLRSIYETHLVSVKSTRYNLPNPRCYISHLKEQKSWVERLEHDLISAGVTVLKYRNEINVNDFVLLVGTPAYKEALDQGIESVAMDINLIKRRLRDAPDQTIKIIPLLRDGDLEKAFPQNILNNQNEIIFTNDTRYIVGLFDLILTLYSIPFHHPTFGILRTELDSKWKKDLLENPEKVNKPERSAIVNPSPVKVFISYAREDEKYKKELIKILAPLQAKRLIEIWDDRKIELGNDWYKAIKDAMNTCELALLLISADFLNSPFITKVEMRQLFKRRKKEGLRVVPIIVKQCMWQDVDILRGLQAPRDGKPVADAKGKNERDRVWTEIGKAIQEII